MVKDLSGERFGSITVLRHSGRKGVWVCRCDCGEEFFASGGDVTRRQYSGICLSCSEKRSRLAPIKTLFGKYRRGAAKRGHSFELTFDEFSNIITKKCAYCGDSPRNRIYPKGLKYGLVYNGIDRKDNSLGYTSENSVPCCGFCNRAKSINTVEELVGWIGRIRGSGVD